MKSFFVLLFLLPACATGMTANDLLKQMQEGKAPFIVDVRSQREYDKDHIPGSIHIPFYAISSRLASLSFSKNDPILVYCEHGPRAEFAAFSLLLSGYKKIYSVEGQMKRWRQHQFPLETIIH